MAQITLKKYVLKHRGKFLFATWLVSLIWILAGIMPSIINTVAMGDMTLNAGGWLYDEKGNIVGLWDGHIGDKTLNPFQVVSIIYRSMAEAPLIPLSLWASLSAYWILRNPRQI